MPGNLDSRDTTLNTTQAQSSSYLHSDKENRELKKSKQTNKVHQISSSDRYYEEKSNWV